MEQVLWKTNWKLAGKLLYNQGCKKDSHVITEDGKKSIRTEPMGGDQEEKEDPDRWILALGSERVEPQTGCPTQRRQAPLATWRTARTDRKAGET